MNINSLVLGAQATLLYATQAFANPVASTGVVLAEIQNLENLNWQTDLALKDSPSFDPVCFPCRLNLVKNHHAILTRV